MGISGATGERRDPPTASALILPAFTCGSTACTALNMNATSPAMSPVIAPAEPLYGTCSISIPAVDLNSSPAR